MMVNEITAIAIEHESYKKVTHLKGAAPGYSSAGS